MTTDNRIDGTDSIRRLLDWRLAIATVLLIMPIVALVHFYKDEQAKTLQTYNREVTALRLLRQVNGTLVRLFDESSEDGFWSDNKSQNFEALLTHIEALLIIDNYYFVNTQSQWGEVLEFYKKEKDKTKNKEVANLNDGLLKLANRLVSLTGIAVYKLTLDDQSVEINTAIFSEYLSIILMLNVAIVQYHHSGDSKLLAVGELKKYSDEMSKLERLLVANSGYFSREKSLRLDVAIVDLRLLLKALIEDVEAVRFYGASADSIKLEAIEKIEKEIQLVKSFVADDAAHIVPKLMAHAETKVAYVQQKMKMLVVAVSCMVLFALLLGYYVVKSLRLTRQIWLDQNRMLETTVNERTQALSCAHNKLVVLAEELKSQTEKANRANKAKILFLASMSHEIRTPLNAIIGGTTILERNWLKTRSHEATELNPEFLDKKAIETLNLLKLSGRALLDLVNDILDFSKIEAGELRIDSVSMDLEDIIIAACDSYAQAAADKGLKLNRMFDICCEGRWLGDPTRIRQVVINFLDNAIKFTDQGGITVSVNLEERGVEISVADTGIGMPDSVLKNLYQSFTQADNTFTRKYGGTGLGLSISRKLCELMRGNISVTTEVGKGSTFKAQIPLEREKVIEPSVQDGVLDGISIVAVQVSPITIALFEQWGATVTTATSEHSISKALLKTSDNQTNLVIVVSDDAKTISSVSIAALCKTRPSIYLGAIPPENQDLFKFTRQYPPKNSVLRKVLKSCATGLDLLPSDDAYRTAIKYSGHILLVEDVEFNRLLAADFLVDMGLKIEFAANGQQAVELFRENRYQIVLMDIHMPIMNGIEATKAIRAYEVEHSQLPTPIIAVTADVIMDTFNAIYMAGMDDIIVKPFEEKDFHNVFRRFLPSYCQLEVITKNQATPVAKAVEPTSAATAVLAKTQVTEPIVNEFPVKTAQSEPELVFDSAGLERRVRNRVERALKLIESFKHAQANYLMMLRRAVAANDLNAVREQAHSIKGVSANIGLNHVSAIVSEIEMTIIARTSEAAFADSNLPAGPQSIDPRLRSVLDEKLEALEIALMAANDQLRAYIQKNR